jgi:drug/metabolite transporter (DMT)-like permease
MAARAAPWGNRGGTVTAMASGKARGTVLRGILSMLLGGACFAVMDALVKGVAPRFPVLQIIFFRSLFAFLPILMQIRREGGRAALRTRHLGGHLRRSLCGFLSLSGFVYAFGNMPLADVIAIGFSAPIFITALSVPLLGESVGIRRWSAVLVGFVGVLIMVRPGTGLFQETALIALVSTLFYGLAMIFIRGLGRTEGTGAIAFYYSLTCTVLAGASLPFLWVTPSLGDLLLLVTIGLVGGCGQLFVTAAFRIGPVAVIAPFDYATMIYGAVLGFVFWGEVPDRLLIVGAVIVVASGLYILHRETRRARAQPAAS